MPCPADLATVAAVVRVSYYMLLASAALSVWSLWVYVQNAWVHFRYPDGVPRGGEEKAA